MSEVTKSQFANNALWKFIDAIIRKVAGLLISIFLARLISPEEYGVIALTLVFLTFSDIFILNGFNIALIRKETVSEVDYSTIMGFSLTFSVFLYAIFYLLAPTFAIFYENDELCPVLRTVTILLFFQAIATVIRSKGTRELRFKEMAIAACVSNISSGIIAVILAYQGLGVWALVFQQLLACFSEMVLLIIIFKWKFLLRFSVKTAHEMFKFTLGVLGTSFLDFFGNNASNLVIGKTYSTKDLGYLNRANMFPETIGLNIYNSINSVLLPTLSSRQNDDVSLKIVTRKIMSFTLFIMIPLMAGIAAIAGHLVPVLLTEKWNACIPMIYYCCGNYAINPIRSIDYNIFYAKGLSEKCVRIEIIRSILMISGVILVAIIMKWSLMTVLFSNMMVSVITSIASQIQVNKIIGYSLKELLEDLLPSLFLSIIMMAVVVTIGKIHINEVALIILQLLVGGFIFILGAHLTHNSNYFILREYIQITVLKHTRSK